MPKSKHRKKKPSQRYRPPKDTVIEEPKVEITEADKKQVRQLTYIAIAVIVLILIYLGVSFSSQF